MAAQKQLEPGSKYAGFDKDGDGTITDEEVEMEEKLMRMEIMSLKLILEIYITLVLLEQHIIQMNPQNLVVNHMDTMMVDMMY